MKSRKKENTELDELAEEMLGRELNKNLSFGGEDEGLIDVLDRADKDSHRRGYHDDEPAAGCPLCEAEDHE